MKVKRKLLGWVALGVTVPFLFILAILYLMGIGINAEVALVVLLIWAVIAFVLFKRVIVRKL